MSKRYRIDIGSRRTLRRVTYAHEIDYAFTRSMILIPMATIEIGQKSISEMYRFVGIDTQIDIPPICINRYRFVIFPMDDFPLGQLPILICSRLYTLHFECSSDGVGRCCLLPERCSPLCYAPSLSPWTEFLGFHPWWGL